jgi:hypothetical protein
MALWDVYRNCLEGGLWIAIGSAARICDSTFNLIDEILAFFFSFFLVSFRATIDIYSIAKAGKKDMVMF